jgi:hypothetical protein
VKPRGEDSSGARGPVQRGMRAAIAGAVLVTILIVVNIVLSHR